MHLPFGLPIRRAVFYLLCLLASTIAPAHAACDLYVTGPYGVLGATGTSHTWRVEAGNRGSTDCVATGANGPILNIPQTVPGATYPADADAFAPYGQLYVTHAISGLSTLSGVSCAFDTLSLGSNRRLNCRLPTTVPAGTRVLVDVTTSVYPDDVVANMCDKLLIAAFPNSSLSLLSTPDENPSNNAGYLTTASCGAGAPGLRIATAKSVDLSSAYVGEIINYTVTLANTTAADPSDTSSATVNHQLVDNLPLNVEFVSVSTPLPVAGGFSSCGYSAPTHRVVCSRFASLRPGEIVTAQIAVRAIATGPALNTCTGTATGSATPVPPTVDNSACTASTLIGQPGIEVSKVASAAVISAGSPISWTVRVLNTSSISIPNVVVVDTLPDGLTNVVVTSVDFSCSNAAGVITCSAASLTPGSHDILISALAPVEAGEIVNVCDATAPDGTAVVDEDCRASTIVTEASGVDVSKTGPGTVAAGAPIAWTINVNSTGPSAATAVTVTDQVPAGVTGIVASSSSFTCTVAAGVVSCSTPSLAVGPHTIAISGTAPTVAGSITNTCTVVAGSATTTGACSATTIVTETSGINVSKSGPGTVAAGAPIAWTINVESTGPSAATAVTVTDQVPAGVTGIVASSSSFTCTVAAGVVSCSTPSLAVGPHTIAISGTAPTVAGSITNTCTVVAGSATTTGACSATTIVTEQPLLTATKDGTSTVRIGERIDWVISVSVIGGTFTDVVLNDSLPDGVTSATVSSKAFACEIRDVLGIRCSAESLAPGRYEIAVSANAPQVPGTVVNLCVVAATGGLTDDSLCRADTGVVRGDPPPSGNPATPVPALSPLAALLMLALLLGFGGFYARRYS